MKRRRDNTKRQTKLTDEDIVEQIQNKPSELLVLAKHPEELKVSIELKESKVSIGKNQMSASNSKTGIIDESFRIQLVNIKLANKQKIQPNDL